MAYATFMVHLEPGRPNAGLLQIAGDLAERFHAGIVGIALSQPMQVFSGGGVVPGAIYDLDRDETRQDIRAVEAEFHGALDARVDDLEWRSLVTCASLAGYLADEARRADFVITKVECEGSLLAPSRHACISDLVMELGRPVLIVPQAATRLALDHAVIGWKDSRETRRAVLDALPFLKEAGRVSLVEIAPLAEQAQAYARLAQVAGWLKRHGIVAERMVVDAVGNDVAQLDAILREANADLFVAGAYGHSRMREWVLGGVTRDLLLHSAWSSFVSH